MSDVSNDALLPNPLPTDAKGNPITYLERPANPQPGDTWLLPDFTLRVFCTDAKWRGVYVSGKPEGDLYDLPEGQQ
jgi:hypothetical protein